MLRVCLLVCLLLLLVLIKAGADPPARDAVVGSAMCEMHGMFAHHGLNQELREHQHCSVLLCVVAGAFRM